MLKKRSSGGSKKEELFDSLYQSIDREFGSGDGKANSLAEWALSLPVILDGRPFTFERHEYLRGPYDDIHPNTTFLKSTQMGLSSLAMLRGIYNSRFRDFRGILYLLPGRWDALEFSKARVAPLIEHNPETIGQWIRETDAASIKQVWNCFWYFRGMNSRAGLKSIPIDFLICDELDEAPQNALDMAMERMSHSEFKEVLKLSNPTLPDYGIDKAFQETDQRYWHLKCPSCGAWTCMEETFPACLMEINGNVIRACQKCQGELNPSMGEWVAKHPSVTDRRGYHFSQLFSHFVDPADILHQFRTTSNLRDFWNLKIGVAYVEAENRLSVEEVLGLCGNEGISSQDSGPCFMGIDQGNDIYVVIGKKYPGKIEIIYLGIYKAWEELDRLMNNFNVSLCVVDALPETRNARAFAERHKGRVFLNYYSHSQKGAYSWNEAQMVVTSNRTESLDASHNEIMGRQVTLPRESDIVREFAKHLHNTAKKLEEDEETGSKRYVYVKLGPDHFRHAYNYFFVAVSAGPPEPEQPWELRYEVEPQYKINEIGEKVSLQNLGGPGKGAFFVERKPKEIWDRNW